MFDFVKRFFTFYGNNFAPKLYEIVRLGYSREHFKRDVAAGLTVAIISLPLAMAFAIASGVSPAQGLYTAIVAGFFISLFGGSRYQIGGPTGAFVIIIFNIIQQHQYSGLLMAMMIAGIILLVAGFLRLGNYVKYIPFPVIIGLTSGIAILLFSTQIKDLFGLEMTDVPAEILPKWQAYFASKGQYSLASIIISLLTFGVIFFIEIRKVKLPAYLVGLALATVLVIAFAAFKIEVDTIGNKFGSLPLFLPKPEFPEFNLELALRVFPSALTIAFLTAVESLLSATVIDGISGDNHNPNAEIIAGGIATIASAAFIGLPATGAVARTTANYKAKAYSPVSGILQSVFLLLFMLLLSPISKYIPLAALAVVLTLIAYNMFGFNKFYQILSGARGDRWVLLSTFFLTVFVDLNVAISIGFILSSIIFMHSMSEEVEVEADDAMEVYRQGYEVKGSDIDEKLSRKGVMSIRFSGPLFFGAASTIAGFFKTINPPKVLILRMSRVNVVDASGANALVEFLKRLKEYDTKIIFSHIRKQPQRVLIPILKHAGLYKDISQASTFENAVNIAKKYIRELEKEGETKEPDEKDIKLLINELI
ncbi:MAG: SulP family inorganic anion transporter [Alphaproteobacteria bacterium]|nr:SulP family inorganic anion transporter [Alphaproteobacteria bacterium]